MRIVFFGPPGSGKGTQAELISRRFDLVHLSTGTLFREEVSKGTDLGRRIREIMESGALISDEIVNEQVFSRISGIPSFLLDGYPRNAGQALELDGYLENLGRPLTGVIMLTIPVEEIVRRLTGRLSCLECGFISRAGDYDKGNPCPRCGESLVIREDDRPEIIRERLDHYNELAGPLEDFYGGRMTMVNSSGSVPDVDARIVEVLSKWQ